MLHTCRATAAGSERGMWPATGQLRGIAQSTASILHCKRGRSCSSPTSRRRLTPCWTRGGFYPHHNLYYVVSDRWDLEVLGGLLLSDIANLFVGAYCVKIRGGTYRFQAQYLRKIRVPTPDAIDAPTAAVLAHAFRHRDRAAATDAAAALYGINSSDLLGVAA